MTVIEDKCDDCNDDHAVGKQHFICNHLTTPFAGGRLPSGASGAPQGQYAAVYFSKGS